MIKNLTQVKEAVLLLMQKKDNGVFDWLFDADKIDADGGMIDKALSMLIEDRKIVRLSWNFGNRWGLL